MPMYPIDAWMAVDPNNPNMVVASAEMQIFDPTDTGNVTPLAVQDPNGLPTTLHANDKGFGPAFLSPVPNPKWVSGENSGYFYSFKGVLDEAAASKVASQDAAASAAVAASAAAASEQYAQGPTDVQADAAVRRAAKPSNLALASDGVPYILPGANDISVYVATDGDYYFTN